MPPSYPPSSEKSRKQSQESGGAPVPTKPGPKPAPERPPTSPASLKASLESATEALAAARAHMVATATASCYEEAADLAERLGHALEEIHAQTGSADEMISEQSLLRVLASVGTQMSAFVHEIRALLGASQAVEHALDDLASDPDLTRARRQKLKKVLQAIKIFGVGSNAKRHTSRTS